VSVTLIAGLFQLLIRVCRLGVVATYMSMPFIGGFMAGSAIQIMIAQVNIVLFYTLFQKLITRTSGVARIWVEEGHIPSPVPLPNATHSSLPFPVALPPKSG
jgi:MFS superfamily sulfate permease-like transporter